MGGAAAVAVAMACMVSVSDSGDSLPVVTSAISAAVMAAHGYRLACTALAKSQIDS
jgi:Na+-transporting NADH:ubiquinone oxidoreductase subunit NqrF